MKKLLFISSIVLLALAMKKPESKQPLTFEQAAEDIIDKSADHAQAKGTGGDSVTSYNNLAASVEYFITTYPNWKSDWNSSARPPGWQTVCKNICLFGFVACWQDAGRPRDRAICIIDNEQCLRVCGRLPDHW